MLRGQHQQAGLIQTLMHTGLQRMNREEVDEKVAAFFYANGIAFYASRSLEFREMVDAIARHGAAYTAPKYDTLQTTLLDRAGARCKSQGLAFLAKENKRGFTIATYDTRVNLLIIIHSLHCSKTETDVRQLKLHKFIIVYVRKPRPYVVYRIPYVVYHM